MENLQIEFPSLLENLRMVESFIDKAKEKFNISDDLYGNIMVSVTESVNNAIVHGNHNDEHKKVKLAMIQNQGKLVCTIEDEGSGFDYDSLPDPTAPENLHKVGGRGVFLMKSLSDEVTFLENGRKVQLGFNL